MKCKAAHSRHLLRALEVIARDVAGESLEDRHAVRCVRHANLFYDVLERNNYTMPVAESSAAMRHCLSSLGSYTRLARLATERGQLAWACTFKFHWWVHLAATCKHNNPRTGWVFADEDWVGKIATIAHSSSYGRGDTRLTSQLVQKYLLGTEVSLSFAQQWR